MKKLLVILLCLLLASCSSVPTPPKPEDDPNPDDSVTPEITFNIGDKVTYSEHDWYILSLDDTCCTMVSAEADYSDSIYFDYDLMFGMIRHFTDEKLRYEDSAMKLYLEEEIAPQLGELTENDGYTIRLLTLSDIRKIVPLENKTDDNGLEYYVQTDDGDYSWLIGSNSWCWTMEECQDDLPDTVYGETKSQQYQHYSWYTLTNYGHIEVTSVGTRRDDSIKIVINISRDLLNEISQ